MNDIEKYAVGLVGEGAESYAEDDTDEEGQFADEADWRTAADLAVKMARAIKNNADAFFVWYWTVTVAEASN